MSNKKLAIWSFLFVLFLPLMFQGPHEAFTFQRYLIRCLMPLMMLGVFWINYLWTVPKALKDNDYRRLIIINVLIVILTCIILNLWHGVEITLVHDRPMTPPRHRMMGEKHHDFFFFIAIRDGINVILSVLIAYAIRMSQHVTLLRQKQQESEVARRDAELRGLRNQISPHFLLNTLNNIYALAAISAERTQSAVMQLSRMLRHMLYDNQDEFVTLASEANFIESYVELMRLRLSSNVNVETHIDISPESKTLVAPLLFISLVENAFKHGVSASEPCHVSITLEENDDTIHCLIKNSNHPKTPADRSGHGIGLQNVQSRLDMTYQGHYTWTKEVVDNDYVSEIEISK